MIFADVEQVPAERFIRIKRGEVGVGVNAIQLVVNVASAQLVAFRNVEVSALYKVFIVLECGSADGDIADLDRPGSAGSICGRGSVSQAARRATRDRHIFLEDAKVVGAEVRVRGNRGEAGRGRRLYLSAASPRQSNRLPFKIREEEELVLDDGSAEGEAIAVTVKAGIGFQALERVNIIDGIQIAVAEVLIQHAVIRVGAALDDGIELASRRVTEFGAELVLEKRETLDGVIGDNDQISGHRFVVVIHALNREVVVIGPLAADRRAGAEAQRTRLGNAGAEQRKIQHAGSQAS